MKTKILAGFQICINVPLNIGLLRLFTASRMSKYGVISGPYFPVFGSEITPYLDTFHVVLTKLQALTKFTDLVYLLKKSLMTKFNFSCSDDHGAKFLLEIIRNLSNKITDSSEMTSSKIFLKNCKLYLDLRLHLVPLKAVIGIFVLCEQTCFKFACQRYTFSIKLIKKKISSLWCYSRFM